MALTIIGLLRLCIPRFPNAPNYSLRLPKLEGRRPAELRRARGQTAADLPLRNPEGAFVLLFWN